MTHAIRIHETGGPEVLTWEEVDVGAPGPGEALVAQHAVGLNFIDTYQRSGTYPLPLPATLGQEGAGVVEAVGPGVTEVAPGDRVAYAGPLGAYAEKRRIAAQALVKLPPSISFSEAAAVMLKGLTAAYLILRVHEVKRGETILFHAAAGGVGLIATRWAKSLGATVIGTVGSDEKGALAKENGCDHVIVYSREDFVARVGEITKGEKARVVYDGVGKDTFYGSLDCLAPRGLLASFGQASGPIAPLDVGLLARKGSLFLTRPSLGAYTATRGELVSLAEALFAAIGSGAVQVTVNQRYPLREAARAHADLAARKTTGSTVLEV